MAWMMPAGEIEVAVLGLVREEGGTPPAPRRRHNMMGACTLPASPRAPGIQPSRVSSTLSQNVELSAFSSMKTCAGRMGQNVSHHRCRGAVNVAAAGAAALTASGGRKKATMSSPMSLDWNGMAAAVAARRRCSRAAGAATVRSTGVAARWRWGDKASRQPCLFRAACSSSSQGLFRSCGLQR